MATTKKKDWLIRSSTTQSLKLHTPKIFSLVNILFKNLMFAFTYRRILYCTSRHVNVKLSKSFFLLHLDDDDLSLYKTC